MTKKDGTKLRPWLRPRVTAADLARQANVSHQYVSSVLRGEKPPSDRLIEAARQLGIPVDVVFGEHDGVAA